MSKRDTLYEESNSEPGSFRFDERVVEVFPDMINRSVPGYALIVPMIGQLARRYVKPHSTVHDLGSSLGAATLAIQDALQGRDDLHDVRLIATDNSPAMVSRFRALLEERAAAAGLADPSTEEAAVKRQAMPPHPVTVNCADVRDIELRDASLVVLNFTLQFLALEERDRLMRRISDGLQPGGVLVLAEKIRFIDEGEQQRQTDWHHDYKRLQGYSDMEIARKRTALEAVLTSELEATHRERLQRAGFRRVTRWFQCFGFCAWLAEK